MKMDNPGLGEVAAQPGQTKVDAVALEDRPACPPLDQQPQIRQQLGIPGVLVHEQVAAGPLLTVKVAQLGQTLIFGPVVSHLAVGGVGATAAHRRVEPAALVERFVVGREAVQVAEQVHNSVEPLRKRPVTKTVPAPTAAFGPSPRPRYGSDSESRPASRRPRPA